MKMCLQLVELLQENVALYSNSVFIQEQPRTLEIGAAIPKPHYYPKEKKISVISWAGKRVLSWPSPKYYMVSQCWRDRHQSLYQIMCLHHIDLTHHHDLSK